MIERKIIIGAIVSTEYLLQIKDIWNIKFFESSTAKRIGRWVWDYFLQYNKAPGKNIEAIFYEKLKSDKNLPKDVAEEIEEDILPGLSEEYTQENMNLDYLIDQTRVYFNERNLTIHTALIQANLNKGELLQAEQLACEYKPLTSSTAHDIDLSNESVLDRIDKAFNTDTESLIRYRGPLGDFWNDQLVRGGFVALLAPEKRGKTWWLLELANKACIQKRKVAFFQAGDMSEGQQLKRICIHRAGKSNMERYSGKMMEPVLDCVLNQINDCTKEERECDFGIFEGLTMAEVKYEMDKSKLTEAWKDNKDYTPCKACEDWKVRSIGVPWIKEVDVGNPLTTDEAKQVISDFFIKYNVQFKISTHPNDTLSIKAINAILDVWVKQDGFVPDVIIIDYADLLIADGYEKDHRQQQNKIWKGLRGLSQVRGNPLVITATQADANSYEKNSLKMTNFSEDKRKFGHVTAMWGLNQDPKDREKKIGIMRINEIVVREGEFFNSREIKVLQNLKRGRPFLGSYW